MFFSLPYAGLISRRVRNVVWAAERYYSQAINISLKSPKHRNCSQNADATFSLGGGSSALQWGFYFFREMLRREEKKISDKSAKRYQDGSPQVAASRRRDGFQAA